MRGCLTGGAGFIGSAACRRFVRDGWTVLNIDNLTYAGNLSSLAEIADAPGYSFEQADIVDTRRMAHVISAFQPDVIVHFAAETHVDRSISGADVFLETNVLGTHALLEAAQAYWATLDSAAQDRFRFLHISTDEVFGDLGETGAFTEQSPYAPRSPYAASKAAADHLVRAWRETHGLPVVIANCSNNYGPYQFPEKLIPLTIINALEGKPIAVYGDGGQVRDWLHVDDHVSALKVIVERAPAGQTYVIGARNERRNLGIVHAICDAVDEMAPNTTSRRDFIQHVADRPGHDRRYAIDPSKIERELGWKPATQFEAGLQETVRWFLDRRDWWGPIRAERYAGERLGLKT